MNQDLKRFIFSVLRVVLPTAMLVASATFVTLPYTLGHHPGEAGTAQPARDRHMT